MQFDVPVGCFNTYRNCESKIHFFLFLGSMFRQVCIFGTGRGGDYAYTVSHFETDRNSINLQKLILKL